MVMVMVMATVVVMLVNTVKTKCAQVGEDLRDFVLIAGRHET